MSFSTIGKIRVSSPEETVAIGRTIAENLKGGTVIGLCGPLGAGKTELTKSIAAGLGILDDVSSPTFVLEAIYNLSDYWQSRGIKTFHHWDLYRITSGWLDCDLFDISAYRNCIIVVEWPERVPDIEALLTARILINFADSGNSEVSDCAQFRDTGERLLVFEENPEKNPGSAIFDGLFG